MRVNLMQSSIVVAVYYKESISCTVSRDCKSVHFSISPITVHRAGSLKLQGPPSTGSGSDKFGQYTSTTTKWAKSGSTDTLMEVSDACVYVRV